MDAFGRIYACIDEARERVWVTVSFAQPDMRLPGREETFWDIVGRAANRGVDVRLLFWWSEYTGIGSFRGEPDELAALRARGCRAKLRWDAIRRGCHHQKTYVIDNALAFVGGINITQEAHASPRHDSDGFHDLFAEIRGPSTADVERNFIERWNQASVTRERGHAFPSAFEAAELEDGRVDEPAPRGTSPVQIVRTIPAGLYRGHYGWEEGERRDLGEGEYSVRDAVCSAIRHARRSIYIENQFLMDPPTIMSLAEAACRGVEVICLVPLEPDANLLLYPKNELERTRKALAHAARHPAFGLFGIRREIAPYRPIYVHAKLMIVDDALLQIGSANLWPPSYVRDTEMNAVVWDPALARATRERLWAEHLLGAPADGLGRWRELARRHTRGDGGGAQLGARIVEIDPRRYYTFPDGLVAPWKRELDGA